MPRAFAIIASVALISLALTACDSLCHYLWLGEVFLAILASWEYLAKPG
jgi:hypothetical protein